MQNRVDVNPLLPPLITRLADLSRGHSTAGLAHPAPHPPGYSNHSMISSLSNKSGSVQVLINPFTCFLMQEG